MSGWLAAWFALSIACDVAGQLCFKRGADALPDGGAAAFASALLRNRWTLAGCAIYTVEIFVWLRILAAAPLSLAFPVASLNFLGVTLASALVLGEKVGRRQWLGSICVFVGVVIVANSA